MAVFFSKINIFHIVENRKRLLGAVCFLVAALLLVGSLTATTRFGASKSQNYSKVKLTTIVSNPNTDVNITDTSITPQATVDDIVPTSQSSTNSLSVSSVKTKVTVNGQNVPVPDNGTVTQEIPATENSTGLNVQVESHSSNGDPDIVSNNDSSLDIGSSTVEYHYQSNSSNNISVEVNQ